MTLDQEGVRQMKNDDFPHQVDGAWMTEDGLWSLGIATRGVELGKPEIWEPEFAFAREEGLSITAHLMEGQIADLKAKKALGPDVFSIHALSASDDDIAYLLEAGSPVCIATPALARSGHHPSPVSKLMKAGVPLCLSVDSTAGCDTADMFAVMRITMIVERLLHEDAGVYSNRDAIRHTTIEAARFLEMEGEIGRLIERHGVAHIDARPHRVAPPIDQALQVGVARLDAEIAEHTDSSLRLHSLLAILLIAVAAVQLSRGRAAGPATTLPVSPLSLPARPR